MIAFMDPWRADAARWLGNEPYAPVVAVLVARVKRGESICAPQNLGQPQREPLVARVVPKAAMCAVCDCATPLDGQGDPLGCCTYPFWGMQGSRRPADDKRGLTNCIKSGVTPRPASV